MASAIYRGENNNDYRIDTEEQESGYIVSHPTYGVFNYLSNIDSTLTLTGLRNKYLNIDVLQFNAGSGNCEGDRLQISTVQPLCDEIIPPYQLTVQPTNDSVTLRFITNDQGTRQGFLLFYKGK